jgi:hypothetical protein
MPGIDIAMLCLFGGMMTSFAITLAVVSSIAR